MFLFLCLCDIFVQAFIFLPKWFWKCLNQGQERFSYLLFPLSCHFSTKFAIPLLRSRPSFKGMEVWFTLSFDLSTSECTQVYACCESVSRSVVSDSLWLHELWPTSFLCPWNSPGMNTGVGCHSLLQGIFQPRGQTRVPCISGRFFTVWATRETHAWYTCQ